MTDSELIAIVKSRMGFPAINLEIDDGVIYKFLLDGLRKMQDHIHITEYITLGITPGVPVNMTSYKGQFYEIVNVFRASFDFTSQMTLDVNIFNPFIISGGVQLGTKMADYASFIRNRSELDSLIDISWRYIDPNLYLDDYYNSVTVEYIPLIKAIDNIVESWAISWIQEWMIASSKIAIGHIRRKFQLNDSPVTLDGDSLVSEGESKVSELEESLSTKGFLTIIR